MPIAKEVLTIGFTVAAVPGGYITKEAVETYGWQDKVEDGDDIGGTSVPDGQKDAKAPRGRSPKGS